jgi:hypothetical protein
MSPVSRRRKKEKKGRGKTQGQSKNMVRYHCLCAEQENIPLSVVMDFDAMDDGDPTIPPQFSCTKCGGAMYPEYYKGIHGFEYKISNVR